MNSKIGWMSVVLALQLILAAVLLLWGDRPAEASRERLLAFDPGQVDMLSITNDAGTQLLLERAAEGWLLDEGVPADADRVEKLLGTLESLRAPWPVATSSAARDRFDVAEDGFQRHLVLEMDDERVVDLYLGTSPGYRQVHARRADEGEIYSVDLAHYQLPTGEDDWLDKTLLQPNGQVRAIVREGAWRLTHSEDTWSLDQGTADPQVVDELATRLTSLQVIGRAAAEESAAEERAVIRVSDAEGEYTLRVFYDAEADQYEVASDRRPGRYRVAGYQVEPLLQQRDALQASA